MIFPNVLAIIASVTAAAGHGYGEEPAKTSAAGYGSPAPPAKETSAGYGYPPPAKETTVCTPSTWITSSVGEDKSTYLSTKTIVVPYTTVVDHYHTTKSPCPYTTKGESTKTVTSLTTHYKTKTYTKVESEVESVTKHEVVPVYSTGTSYKEDVSTAKETVVSSKTSHHVYTETTKVPYTHVSTGTKSICTTQGGKEGYGSGVGGY